MRWPGQLASGRRKGESFTCEHRRKLFSGELSVEEVPQFWRERMQHELGVTVPDDAQGCLQDIHWSFGAVGYFPSCMPISGARTRGFQMDASSAAHTFGPRVGTDTLGAIMAVQIFNAAERDLGAEALHEQISSAEFSPLREWLREKVHAVGSLHASPDELLTIITGEGVSAKPFLKYLRAKYSELYDLELEPL